MKHNKQEFDIFDAIGESYAKGIGLNEALQTFVGHEAEVRHLYGFFTDLAEIKKNILPEKQSLQQALHMISAEDVTDGSANVGKTFYWFTRFAVSASMAVLIIAIVVMDSKKPNQQEGGEVSPSILQQSGTEMTQQLEAPTKTKSEQSTGAASMSKSLAEPATPIDDTIGIFTEDPTIAEAQTVQTTSAEIPASDVTIFNDLYNAQEFPF